MGEFFDWGTLGTYAGAVALTTLITQFTKEIPGIAKIPTRIFSWVIACLVLLAASGFTGGLTLQSAAMCVVNAFVVAMASQGTYELVSKGISTHK